jgi:glycosyltransferase involved in cell wall biosynthesis
LEERLVFQGFVDDVVPLLHAADAYVMPSLYEGLSVAALEMLGGGLPAVLADVPGISDLRQHIPDAIWVDPTPASVAAGLERVSQLSASDRQRWSTETAARVRDIFGVERFAQEYVRLYEELARRRRSL